MISEFATLLLSGSLDHFENPTYSITSPVAAAPLNNTLPGAVGGLTVVNKLYPEGKDHKNLESEKIGATGFSAASAACSGATGDNSQAASNLNVNVNLNGKYHSYKWKSFFYKILDARSVSYQQSSKFCASSDFIWQ